MENSLAKIDAVRLALEQAVTVQEVKDVIDKIKTVETYARQTKAGQDIQLNVAEYIVRAERKLGESIQAAKEAGLIGKGKPFHKHNLVANEVKTFTLEEAGISWDLSSRAQKLADIPGDTFEQEIVTEKASGMVSSKKVIKAGRNGTKPSYREKPPPPDDAAAPAVIDLHDKGLTSSEISEQTGIQPRKVRHIIEKEKVRRSVEPAITPDILSQSAQQKLETAIKQHRQKLDREFDAAVHTAARRYLDIVSTRWRDEQKQAKRVMERRKGFMTRATYKLILSCLHPDWVTDYKQKSRYENAFSEFTKMEKCLLSEKDSPTDFVAIPKTAAEWEELKRQVTEARKAKRQATNLARR